MRYTMLLRDEDGKETKITELVASNILHSPVFLCPYEGAHLTNVDAAVLLDALQSAGVNAIICHEPIRLYQLQTYGDAPE